MPNITLETMFAPPTSVRWKCAESAKVTDSEFKKRLLVHAGVSTIRQYMTRFAGTRQRMGDAEVEIQPGMPAAQTYALIWWDLYRQENAAAWKKRSDARSARVASDAGH